MFIVVDSTMLIPDGPISNLTTPSCHLPSTFALTFWLCENCMENAKSRRCRWGRGNGELCSQIAVENAFIIIM